MKYVFKRLLFALFMTPVIGLAQSAPTSYQPSLDSIYSAFKQRDYAFVKPMLDPNVKIGDLPKGLNDMVVPQILAQLPEPKSYTVMEANAENDGTRVYTRYIFANGDTAQRSFLFDKTGKITDFDILEGVKARAASVSSAPTTMPDRFELPFEVKEGIIYVKASLNGKKEDFILDSGAPLLILNGDHQISDSITKTAEKVHGVGGAAETGITHIKSFDWNGLQINDADVMTMSLKHLKNKRTSFAGLIGYDIFKNYQLTFDYRAKKITAVRADLLQPDSTALATVSSEIKGHLPVFTMKIDNKTYRMALDCGAGGNLLYARYVPELDKQVKNLKKANLAGAGSDKVKARSGKISNVVIGGVSYKDMSFAFEDETLDQLNQGYNLGIDGLLGYEFLKQHVTSINFKTGEILIYGNE